MTCAADLRQRARRDARELRGPNTHVAIQSPQTEPANHWSLDVAVESPAGPGLPPELTRTIGARDLWLRDVAPQGEHYTALAVVAHA